MLELPEREVGRGCCGGNGMALCEAAAALTDRA